MPTTLISRLPRHGPRRACDCGRPATTRLVRLIPPGTRHVCDGCLDNPPQPV